jgi:predicted GNAT family N-acyltransferase
MEVIIRAPLNEGEWNAYFDLRFRILRQPLGQARGSERNEGDETGVHFALYENGELKAIARLDQHEAGIAQVRFVAVEHDTQGKGFGREIMGATEKFAAMRGDKKIILHARDYAVPFYLKLNYRLLEKSYKLFDVLQHFLMEKELTKR